MTVRPSPRRRKLRMLRPGEPPEGTTLLVRAAPVSVDEAVLDIAEDALESAEIYEVDRPIGGRVALYGVSVFALWPGRAPVDVLRRFASSPYHLQARAADVRAAGFDVLATGSNPDHFDVLLVDGRAPEELLLPLAPLVAAARRLVDACGELRPNPAYSGGSHG